MELVLKLDGGLLQKAMELAEVDSEQDVVEIALNELIERRSRKNLLDLKGSIEFSDGYGTKN